MKKILFQFDTDPLPSSFDRVVALDAGVDEVMSYGGVTCENVASLVHGAIFTRKPDDLKNSAIFIGGSDLAAAEKILATVRDQFIGTLSCSILFDPSGAVTTAAAAVRSVANVLPIKGKEALILGGTGPVGTEVGYILASQEGKIRIASRTPQKAEATSSLIRSKTEGAQVTACDSSDDGLAAAVDGIDILISAGAAGVRFLTTDEWQSIDTLKVAIDLNAVPPAGLEGIPADTKGADFNGITAFGALGVGGFKMKLHKAALAQIFTTNNLVLAHDEVYALSAQI